MNTQRGSGFILVMTLLLLMVFSMFVLTILQRLTYTLRLNEQVNEQHQAFYALEAVAQTLQTTFLPKAHACVMHERNLFALTPQDLFYRGCTLDQDGVVYHYLLVDLGVFPCLRLSTKQGNQGSHHWWLILSSERLHDVALWLRIAVPEMQSICPAQSIVTNIRNPLSWYLQHTHFQLSKK